jgi:uncharacterized protein with von Willebrand factor type A (vWA) domain
MLTKDPKSIALPSLLWQNHKMIDNDAQDLENSGKAKYEAFPEFAKELFDELYSMSPAQTVSNDNNKWAIDFLDKVKNHDKSEDGQENQFDMLRRRSVNNETWSSISTDAMLAEFVNKINVDGQIQDTNQDRESLDYLKRLLDAEENTEDDNQNIKNEINNLNKQIEDKVENNNNILDNMDNSEVRNAIRGAVKKANEQIDQMENAIAACSFGDQAHSGINFKNQIGKKLAPMVKNNKRMQKILEIAGRLKRVADNELRKKSRDGTDEICGIDLDNDLARMLPSEALYALDPDMEIIFAKKYTNSEIMEYELEKEPEKQTGPLVVLLDQSGSMGSRDKIEWAMGVVLAFLDVAAKQKRHFAVVHFGENVLRTDFFEADKLTDTDKVLDMINFFAADGGTNFESPIKTAIDLINISNNAKFGKADIIMVTDGEAMISEDLAKQVNKERDNGLKFFSILVGTEFRQTVLEPISDEIVALADCLKEDKKMFSMFGKVGS